MKPNASRRRAPDATEKVLSGWMSRAELAQELGVSTDTLERWAIQRSGPPSARIGRRVYYRREAVIEWLRDREVKGPGR